MKQLSRAIKNHWLTLLVWGVLFVGLLSVSILIPQEKLEALIDSAGFFGPVVFIFITLTTFIVAPLSGAPLHVIGFATFGEKTVLYSSIAAWISFTTNFLIARKWGREVVIKFVGSKAMNKVDQIAVEYGGASLIFLRMFQGFMHDFISYAAGLTKIGFGKYLISSTIGAIPGALIWYWGAVVLDNPFLAVIFGWVVGFVFTGLYVVLKKLAKG